MSRSIVFTWVTSCLISGCAVNGDYTCGVPANGVRCQSMDVTHQQLYDGSLNSLHSEPYPEPIEDSDSFDDNDDSYEHGVLEVETGQRSERVSNPVPAIKTIESKQAILSQPREMRIWFDRFTDIDGDLHDESFVFIRLDNGHWVIDNKPVLY